MKELDNVRNIVYFPCLSELPYPNLAPARVLPASATLADLVNAQLAGPSTVEGQARFTPGARGVVTDVETKIVGDVLVINLLKAQPMSLFDGPGSRLGLVASLARATEAKGVSVLVRGWAWCSWEGVC